MFFWYSPTAVEEEKRKASTAIHNQLVSTHRKQFLVYAGEDRQRQLIPMDYIIYRSFCIGFIAVGYRVVVIGFEKPFQPLSKKHPCEEAPF